MSFEGKSDIKKEENKEGKVSSRKRESCLFIYITEKMLLYRFVFILNKYFNMEVKTCTAVAVVNLRIRGFVR